MGGKTRQWKTGWEGLAGTEVLGRIRDLSRRLPGSRWYLVGGAVRDLALGQEAKDLDFVVQGAPADRLTSVLSAAGQVNLVGKNFGVFKFAPRGIELEEPIEIALPRTERPTPDSRGGYRDFIVQGDASLPVETDLGRRDFTINAMAIEATTGSLVDPFGGLQDLEAGRIRAVGDPRTRFLEDLSRILRGLRLSCQLGFRIEEETWTALVALVPRLSDQRGAEYVVPRETIGRETTRAFTHHPVQAFDLFDRSGVTALLMPELIAMRGCPQPPEYHSEGDVWTHTRLALAALSSERFRAEFDEEPLGAELVFAVLFHDCGKPPTLKTPERDGADRIRFDGHDRVGARIAREICDRLRLSGWPRDSRYHIDCDHLSWLVEHHLLPMSGPVEAMKNATIERYFFSGTRPGRLLLQLILADGLATYPPAGPPQARSYQALRKRVDALEALLTERRRLPPPLLNGHDVMREFGIPPGPEVGRLVTAVREAQLSGKVRNREEALEFLRDARAASGA